MKRDILTAWALLSPALFFVAVFLFYATAYGILLSFTNFNLLQPKQQTHFVGFLNYKTIISDAAFKETIMKTAIWVTSVVCGALAIAFPASLALVRSFHGRTLIRVLILVPWVIPNVVAALIWRWIFEPTYGLINYFGIHINWLGDPQYAFIATIIAGIWKAVPVTAVTILAGLQSLPGELYEAARVDGANAMQQFMHITWPLIRPLVGMITILQCIWNAISSFDLIWVMTRGGPARSTTVLSVYLYQNAFQFFRMGYAAANGVVLLIILSILMYVYLKFAAIQQIRK